MINALKSNDGGWGLVTAVAELGLLACGKEGGIVVACEGLAVAISVGGIAAMAAVGGSAEALAVVVLLIDGTVAAVGEAWVAGTSSSYSSVALASSAIF